MLKILGYNPTENFIELEKKGFYFDEQLLATLFFLETLRRNKNHILILVTGEVGSGKSTLVEQIVYIFNKLIDDKRRQIDITDCIFSFKDFLNKMSDENYKNKILWWDEAIQGMNEMKRGISNIADFLKTIFITQRFKQNVYILVTDELKEFNIKLIKMCHFWVHTERIGLERGFFKGWYDKRKIEKIYFLLKDKNKTMNSLDVLKVKPDLRGRFNDYQGWFINLEEYYKKKTNESLQDVKEKALKKLNIKTEKKESNKKKK